MTSSYQFYESINKDSESENEQITSKKLKNNES